jgi:hypothetical protein
MTIIPLALAALMLSANSASSPSLSPLYQNAIAPLWGKIPHSPSLPPLYPNATAPQALPGLTIMMGETWIFHIENGQPAGARRAKPDDEPVEGEIKVTLERSGNWVTMNVINNTDEWYDYRAFISAKPGHKGNRTSVCTLASGGFQAMESWPQPFPAIRIADFTEARDGRINCR